jgi:serine/threonine protein phosphatase PrpC
MVLATDGVWDGISVEEAAAFLEKTPSVPEAASKLTQYAEQQLHKKNLDDNITAIVVGLKDGRFMDK